MSPRFARKNIVRETCADEYEHRCVYEPIHDLDDPGELPPGREDSPYEPIEN